MDATTAWLVVAAVLAAGLAVTAAVLLVRVFAARKLLRDAGIRCATRPCSGRP